MCLSFSGIGNTCKPLRAISEVAILLFFEPSFATRRELQKRMEGGVPSAPSLHSVQEPVMYDNKKEKRKCGPVPFHFRSNMVDVKAQYAKESTARYIKSKWFD